MSGGSFEAGDRQMTTAVLELDDELERCAGFSAEVADFEVCSKAWTGLEAWLVASWLPRESKPRPAYDR